jgi:hypothetical protein
MEAWYLPLSILIAVVYTSVIADAFIKLTQHLQRMILKRAYPKKKAAPIVPVLPSLLGLVERILYLIAIYIQQPVFIGFWLTLKAASRWEVWTTKDKDSIPGRAYFNIFLFGNALSILYSFARLRHNSMGETSGPKRELPPAYCSRSTYISQLVN